MPRSLSFSTGALLFCVLAACSSKSTPTPEKEPPSASGTPTTSAAVQNTPPAPTADPVKEIPTLDPVDFKVEGEQLFGLYPIEGAVMVTVGRKVGRITGEKVEWLGSIPKESRWGDSHLRNVYGRYPDAVFALYVSSQGRAPEPTLYPITGKGKSLIMAEGGGFSEISGVARVRETMFIGYRTVVSGYHLEGVWGAPMWRTPGSVAKAGCKPEEVAGIALTDTDAAIVGRALAATRKSGVLVSVGSLCQARGPAADVWDAKGNVRTVDLTPWMKDIVYTPTLLPGDDDDLFLHGSGLAPILRFKDDKVEPLVHPAPGKTISDIFVSVQGKLHAVADRKIFRYDNGQWTAIARLAWPRSFSTLAMDGETIWVESDGRVQRMEKGTSLDFHDGCATPFVYLYDVSYQNPPNFTFPTTRKALSSFPGAAELSLVDFKVAGARRLGVVVTSKAQGEAVIAHLLANMKDEHPELMCYKPENPRKVELN